MQPSRERIWRWALGALVVAAALAAFAPALDNGFVDWDDGIYIRDNPWIRSLSLENLRWMLTSFRAGFWQPLTWLSFAIDHAFWGLEPCGYHLTNVLLHAATAGLFYVAVLRLSGREEGSRGAGDPAVAAAAAALFFAVHPLRVESVAWAAERKDVLSGLFWMAALLAYLRDRKAAALAAYVLALGAKVSAITLPLVFLILEVYPLRRLPADPRRWGGKPLRPVWLSAAPYLIAAAAYLALTAASLSRHAAAATSGGAALGQSAQGLASRAGTSLYGLLFYPLKTLWPVPLSPYYPPQSWFGRWSWEAAACGALVVCATAAIWRSSRRWPVIGAAFASYAVLLAPMSGIVPFGIPASAWDHLSYLPCLGLAVLFGVLVRQAAAPGRAHRSAALLASGLVLAGLGAASRRQTALWHDSKTLWVYAAERAPGCPLALNNFGVTAAAEGRWEEAAARFGAAVAAAPRHVRSRDNLGAALLRLGRRGEAIAVFRAGLDLGPAPLLQSHLGRVLSEGTPAEQAEGEGLLRRTLADCTDCAETWFDLAALLARQGRTREAEGAYGQALQLDPAYGMAHNNLGLILDSQGRNAEAAAHFRAALAVPASRALAHYNWGNSLADRGDLGPARRHYLEALRIAPALVKAEFNLGNTLAREGRYREAAARYRSVLQKDPRFPDASANLQKVLLLSRLRGE